MPDTKYDKFVITKPLNVHQGGATKILGLDSDLIKGAFYTHCGWFYHKSTALGPPTHVHDFDEVLVVAGSNPDDPHDLGGEIEFWIDGEQHVLTESSLLYIPKGLKHCPQMIRRLDRPIFHYVAATAGKYITNNVP